MTIWELMMWVWDQFIRLMIWVLKLFVTVWNAVFTLFNFLIEVVGAIFSVVWRALNALVHLDWTSIWTAVKRAYDRLRRALDWYDRHVLQPIEKIRARIWELYRRFFKPILLVLDHFRVIVRMVAIFNRRLAARLDSALFNLESKLMYPITQMLKRVNALSCYFRAIITRLGLLDRVLLLESLRRDASLVWEVLTNPRARIYGPIVRPQPYTARQAVSDCEHYLRQGVGPLAEAEPRWLAEWDRVTAEVG